MSGLGTPLKLVDNLTSAANTAQDVTVNLRNPRGVMTIIVSCSAVPTVAVSITVSNPEQAGTGLTIASGNLANNGNEQIEIFVFGNADGTPVTIKFGPGGQQHFISPATNIGIANPGMTFPKQLRIQIGAAGVGITTSLTVISEDEP